MESSPLPTPEDAHATLRELEDARRRLAEHVRSPWWYCLGAAACTASLFVGAGLLVGRPDVAPRTESVATALILGGAVLAPMVLLRALRRSTGLSVERYAEGMTAWYLVVFGLVVLGFVLQAFGGQPNALFVAGAAAFAATVVRERRLDGLLRRRITTGGPRTGA